jgi:hypothetical protein
MLVDNRCVCATASAVARFQIAGRAVSERAAAKVLINIIGLHFQMNAWL